MLAADGSDLEGEIGRQLLELALLQESARKELEHARAAQGELDDRIEREKHAAVSLNFQSAISGKKAMLLAAQEKEMLRQEAGEGALARVRASMEAAKHEQAELDAQQAVLGVAFADALAGCLRAPEEAAAIEGLRARLAQADETSKQLASAALLARLRVLFSRGLALSDAAEDARDEDPGACWSDRENAESARANAEDARAVAAAMGDQAAAEAVAARAAARRRAARRYRRRCVIYVQRLYKTRHARKLYFGERERKAALVREGASGVIGRAARAWQRRARLAAKRRELATIRRHNAARRVQAWARELLGRARRFRRLSKAEDLLLLGLVIQLQCAYRSHAARKRADELARARARAFEARMVVKMQTCWRARRNSERVQALRAERAALEQKGALCIQGRVRCLYAWRAARGGRRG